MKNKKVVNIAVSFRARLLDLSRQRREDFQFVLGRWMIERFLYRLSVSPHKEGFVLKGAMLFAAWTGKVYRPTRDLDLLGWGSPDVDRLVTAFREVSMIDGGDGLVFEPARIKGERIRCWPRQRVRVIRLSGTFRSTLVERHCHAGKLAAGGRLTSRVLGLRDELLQYARRAAQHSYLALRRK